ncbi:bifunctional phosphoglucose/phosphomannose isomerase [Candidatus Saccharibacteria bacterium]|nr:bifunctional phosphoglucose/phosphomannose isomerase [Candidatus Saccharibacteria bacterium]
MLDDLKYIHHRDSQDALGIAEKQWQQLEYEFEAPKISRQFDNIVFAGMGGSALAALIGRSWPGYKTPFEVCRQYQIPAYVSDKTLFIASSASGNTEETLYALGEAESHKATIVVITGGGKLQEIAEQKTYPFILLPKVSQPRYGVFYSLNALTTTLGAIGAVDLLKTSEEMKKAANFLRESVSNWSVTVPKTKNPAKKLANELAGKSPVIYAGSLLAPAAYKWKISFNENSKSVAWWNRLPEFNHNEFIGWSSHPVDKPYGIVELRSNLEHDRVQKRFEVGERLLSGRRPAPNVVEVQGETLLEQLLWAVNFGDFVSLYLALLNNVDPGPVDLVEKFKTELNK